MTTIYIIIDDNIKNVAIEYALSIKNKLRAQIINISTNEYYIIKSFNNLSKFIFFGIKYTSYIRYYERDNLNSSNVFFVNLEPLTCNGSYSKYNFLEEVLMFHAN